MHAAAKTLVVKNDDVYGNPTWFAVVIRVRELWP